MKYTLIGNNLEARGVRPFVHYADPDWFGVAAAISSAGGIAIMALMLCVSLAFYSLKKAYRPWAVSAIVIVTGLTASAYVATERLRGQALRAIQFAPFVTNDAGRTSVVAGYDPSRGKRITITDWPWREPACPPTVGAIRGVLKTRDGRPLSAVTVSAIRDDNDVALLGFVPGDLTDAKGHFNIPNPSLGHYGLEVRVNGDRPRPVNAPLVTVGPANRFPTVELLLDR